MQINADISPLISPKSNMSISFMSPRDANFNNVNTTKKKPSNFEKTSDAIDFILPRDLPLNNVEIETSQHAHNTTNESCSIDQNVNGNILSK